MGLVNDLRAKLAHVNERTKAIAEQIRVVSVQTTLLEIQVKQLTDEAGKDGK
jgi:hypothetical protein